jgi:hypothetical protein
VEFRLNDPIFELSRAFEESECKPIDESSQCTSCDETKKLKPCLLCTFPACPKHLVHQRPVPIDNADRKRLASQVCFLCQCKFLYRECFTELNTRHSAFDQVNDLAHSLVKEGQTEYD